MLSKNQVNFIFTARRLIVVFVALLFVFLLEPAFRDRDIFAVTYFDHPNISSGTIKTNYISEAPHNTTQQKTRAPEPTSLFLILSGIGGIVVRFARRSFERFKRYADLVLAILGLLVLSPLLFIAAVFIKLTSPGPVIYRQNRVGQGGEIFRIYKLRTMRVDAEKGSGAVWAKQNDPRISPIGRILRKTHIDEIPQLLNVINGEMSIVGPRPERPEIVHELKEVIRDYEKRLQVKPGITGLAQVWHKYDETIEDVKKKIKYDVLYIKKMCLLVDLRILANTCVVVITGKGAR